MTTLGISPVRVVHCLHDADLAAVCAGGVTAAVLGKLRAAQSSKHRLLVEGVRRRAATWGQGITDLLDGGLRLLGEVEAQSPQTAASVLELPQTGGWAADCLRRMANRRDCSDAGGAYASSLRNDLGYLAGTAVAAALQASHPFDIAVPLRGGVLLLPGLGAIRIDGIGPSGVVRVRSDGSTVGVASGNNTIVLPTKDARHPSPSADWLPVPRLRAEANGIALNVMLDAVDPFLHHVGEPPSGQLDLASWQRLINEAWQVLAHHHPVVASAIVAGLSVLVPLKERADGTPESATSGWTFGAIGLSLPEDYLSLAEALVHELQHLVLGAVEDLTPLVASDGDQQLTYAPWRDDPRPIAGLIHGCYAHLGITAFWRKQYGIGTRQERFRSSAAFARWRTATQHAARTLADSPALTEAGRIVAAGINDELARWQGEPVWAEAQRLGDEARTEHLVRWRLNYLRPADSGIVTLLQAWLSRSPTPHSAIDVATTVQGASSGIRPILGHLLEARYTNRAHRRTPGRGEYAATEREVTQLIDDADAALLRDDDASAIAGYIRRLEFADDMNAWPGLAVALRRTGPPAAAQILAEVPEVAAALHARLRVVEGKGPDPVHLLEWLAPRMEVRACCKGGSADARLGRS